MCHFDELFDKAHTTNALSAAGALDESELGGLCEDLLIVPIQIN